MGWFRSIDRAAPPRRPCRAVALACIAAFAVTSFAPLAAAQRSRPNESKLEPVRDAEIEELLRDYATPVFRAAGLDPHAVQIVLIRDLAFNAFVANGRRIFVNLGTIIDSETPNQLIGVLAHETGHIAGGHLAAMRSKVDAAQTRAIIAMLLGAAAVGAAAASGSSGTNLGPAAGAALTGPQDVVMRDLLSYARSQEQAADQAGVRYLTKTGQSGEGMLQVFKRLSNESMFSSRFADPYIQSHPMPQERIALLERLVHASPADGRTDSEALKQRHAMARAKTVAFMMGAGQVARRYPASDQSLPARYARAISAYRFGAVDAAQRDIDALIATQPNNPYFWELKGQALLEAGRARQAVEPLRKAVALKPTSGLIRIMLGQSMVETGDRAMNNAAIGELKNGLAREPSSVEAYREIAVAYGRAGRNADADLASAQASFYEGQFPVAKQIAERAKRGFKLGSPGWLRADDIVNYRPPKLN